MKYYLLSVSKRVNSINIGDYIQALASSQFLPSIDGFVDREDLKDYDGEECKIIMNGWYMHFPVYWPPSTKINPLFVAMHINILAKERMLMEDSIGYLKKYEPIGCRDIATRDMLEANGVDAYFSGCMTLTLGYKYKYNGVREGVYIVDPVVKLTSRFEKVAWLMNSLLHMKNILKIARKYNRHNDRPWYKLAYVSKFYNTYRKFFTDETLLNATYIYHESRSYKEYLKTEDDRLNMAESLVKSYSKAALVVTSRIHCALPCLGLETPVLYLYDDAQAEVSSCRLDGLLQLFNIIHVDDHKMYSSDINLSDKIDCHTIIRNKDTWRQYAADLSARCEAFVAD